MNVGVMDLVSDSTPFGLREMPYASLFLRQNVSVMPQCVAAWCRNLGHRVTYASYFGQAPPETLLPDDLDWVFLCCTTQASAIAYALARLFRRNGIRTVLGGPHARSFPRDALRFFDIVVGACDRNVISEILDGHVDPPGLIAADAPPSDLPGIAERMSDIRKATFYRGRSTPLSTVPVVASQGCPYQCDFCIDARSTYIARDSDALTEDLRYLGRHHPNVLVAFTDPNFAVRFDDTLEAIETSLEERPLRYVMEASLSILRSDRLARLRESGCVYVAPGIESWFDYRQKAGQGRQAGRTKLDETVEHFAELEDRIGGVQANFILGTDGDQGPDPFELTREFILRRPATFPTISIPTPYGGTPLHEQLSEEGRILERMPFAFYGIPYLTMQLRHYDALDYYDRLVGVKKAVTARPESRRRGPRGIRFIHAIRRIGIRHELKRLLEIRNALESSKTMRDFHEGRAEALPDFYTDAFERKLGPYAELLDDEDRIPQWDLLSPEIPSRIQPPLRANA